VCLCVCVFVCVRAHEHVIAHFDACLEKRCKGVGVQSQGCTF